MQTSWRQLLDHTAKHKLRYGTVNHRDRKEETRDGLWSYVKFVNYDERGKTTPDASNRQRLKGITTRNIWACTASVWLYIVRPQCFLKRLILWTVSLVPVFFYELLHCEVLYAANFLTLTDQRPPNWSSAGRRETSRPSPRRAGSVGTPVAFGG